MPSKKVSLQLLSKQSVGDVWIAYSWTGKEFHKRGPAAAKFRRHSCCMFVLPRKYGHQMTVESAEYYQTRGSNHLPGRQVPLPGQRLANQACHFELNSNTLSDGKPVDLAA